MHTKICQDLPGLLNHLSQHQDGPSLVEQQKEGYRIRVKGRKHQHQQEGFPAVSNAKYHIKTNSVNF